MRVPAQLLLVLPARSERSSAAGCPQDLGEKKIISVQKNWFRVALTTTKAISKCSCSSLNSRRQFQKKNYYKCRGFNCHSRTVSIFFTRSSHYIGAMLSSGFTPSKQQRLHACKEKKRKIMFWQYGTLSSFSDNGLHSFTLFHAKNVAESVRLRVPVPLLISATTLRLRVLPYKQNVELTQSPLFISCRCGRYRTPQCPVDRENGFPGLVSRVADPATH